MTLQIMTGDCIELMRTLPDNSVDSIVTDPPYGLGFMGKAWDALPPGLEWAEECLRVLKPGGHLLAFGGTRTWHRLAVAVEDAGFEIRDSIAWMYGSGFPKSADVSKAIDKAGGNPMAFRKFAKAYAEAVSRSTFTHADIDLELGIKSSSCYWAREDHRGGMPPRRHWESVRNLLSLDSSLEALYDEAEREVVGTRGTPGFTPGSNAVFGQFSGDDRITAPATDAAKQWQGWGTALKPAFEPVIMARKPFKGTVAANVLAHGTGALNIDASRVGTRERTDYGLSRSTRSQGITYGVPSASADFDASKGRFPANVILDEHTAALLDEQSGVTKSTYTVGSRAGKLSGVLGEFKGQESARKNVGDSGGASRFFYCAKAPKSERPVVDGVAHPTVKPLALMRYLITLVTPPGGVVLEPFAGSGTTVEAALLDGFGIIAMERDETYLPLIQARVDRFLTTQMEDLI